MKFLSNDPVIELIGVRVRVGVRITITDTARRQRHGYGYGHSGCTIRYIDCLTLTLMLSQEVIPLTLTFRYKNQGP